MSITTSLARMSAISRQSNAERAAIKASQAQQSLLNSNSKDMAALARQDAKLQIAKEQAELKARAAKAERDALKSKKKLHYFA